LSKLGEELFYSVPESIISKLKLQLGQLDDDDEALPNLRSIQISYEPDPSYAFQSVIELVSFKLGHYTIEDDIIRGKSFLNAA